jgi:hypothetical protein
MSDTPRTTELLSALHDETRHVGQHNCPDRWVRLCRELERENARLREALEREAAGCSVSRALPFQLREEIKKLSQTETERMGGIE